MDDNFDDYFMADNHDADKHEQPQHQETPQEREDREIAEATIERRHNTVRLMLIGAIVAMLVFIAWWGWSRYYHPYEQGQYKGWVIHIASQGSVFKTFEGELLAIAYADDSIVRRDTLHFTIDSDTLARDAMRWNADGRRLVVSYDRYKGTLPWRGSSPLVLTGITMDSDRIERLAPQPVPASETD